MDKELMARWLLRFILSTISTIAYLLHHQETARMKTVPFNHVLLMFYHMTYKLKQLEGQERK